MSLNNSPRAFVAVLTLALVVLLGSATAQAQYEPKYELSLQGGYARTLSTLKDFAEDGFGAGASLGYRFSDRVVFGGDLTFHSFHPNNSVTEAFTNSIDISSYMIESGGFAKLYANTGDRRLYFRGSAGLFYGRTRVNYLGLQGAASTTDPGVSGAVGIELMGRQNSATYLEASYRRIIGEDVHWVSFALGASFFIW